MFAGQLFNSPFTVSKQIVLRVGQRSVKFNGPGSYRRILFFCESSVTPRLFGSTIRIQFY